MPSADGTCTGCSYRISVYAYDANTEFLISATTRVGVRLLSDGVLVTGATGMGEVRYFRFFVRSAADVLLTLTPYSGNPSLLARFGCRPLYESALCNATGGGAGASSSTVWSSANDVGVEQILLPASDPAFCTPPCTLYVAVRGNTSSSFGVIATQAQEQQSLVTLVDGLPQSGSVGADEMTYYRIWARMDEGLTIALTSFLGSPIFYYNARQTTAPGTELPLPTSTLHMGDVYSPFRPLYLPPQQPAGSFADVVIGVGGVGGPSDFQILAHSGGQMARLVEGRPLYATLPPTAGARALYGVDVPWNAAAPAVHVTALQGRVRVLVGIEAAVPTEESHTGAVTAVAGHPASLALTPNTLNTIAVSAPPGVAVDCGAFTLTVRTNAEGAAQVVRLLDGQPQSVPVRAAEPARMHFDATANHSVFISATISAGSVLASVRQSNADGSGSGGGVLPALTLHASAERFDAQPDRCADERHCHHYASAYPGSATFVLTPSMLACDGHCAVAVALSATSDANVTVTASTGLDGGDGVLLPLHLPTCTSVAPGAMGRYTVLLDPADDADDHLAIDTFVCGHEGTGGGDSAAAAADGARLITSASPLPASAAAAPPGSPVRQRAQNTVELPAAQLAGKCEVYAGVVQGDPAAGVTHICVEARPKGTTRGEELLSGEAAALTVEASEADASSELVLSLTTLDAASFGECAKLSYQVWVAHTADDGGASNFFTWCGISRGSAMLHEVSAADLGAAAGRRTLRVPHASVQRRISGTMLGVTHRVTVVALVQPTCTPAAGVGASEAPRVRHLLYEPTTWTPTEAHSAAGVVITLVALTLLLLVACGCAYRHRHTLMTQLRRRVRKAGDARLGLGGHGGFSDFTCTSTMASLAASEAPGAPLRLSQESPAGLTPLGAVVTDGSSGAITPLPLGTSGDGGGAPPPRSERAAAATPSTVPASSERAARGGARAALPRRHRWSWRRTLSATAPYERTKAMRECGDSVDGDVDVMLMQCTV